MPPDLAVGGRASSSLIGGPSPPVSSVGMVVGLDFAAGVDGSSALADALEKLPPDKLQDPHKRGALFKKMVEDCALSAKERAPLDRMFTLADITKAVNDSR